MKKDIFANRKTIHISLDKLTHSVMRTRLFSHGISMQELFEEFANLVACEDSRTTKIIQDLAVKRLEAAIGGKVFDRKIMRQQYTKDPIHQAATHTFDMDLLYDLIKNEKSSDGQD